MDRLFACTLSCLLFVVPVVAQNTAAPKSGAAPEIEQMVKDVSAKRIEATIRKLVSFGTRNTLSEQDNPTRGIGAAHDWIYSEFQKYSSRMR